MDTGRETVRAAAAARDRGQGRLRTVTAAIGVASVLAGGGIAASLAGVANVQPAGASSATHRSSGSSSSSSTPGTGGLQASAAPSSSSGSSQVTSGGS